MTSCNFQVNLLHLFEMAIFCCFYKIKQLVCGHFPSSMNQCLQNHCAVGMANISLAVKKTDKCFSYFNLLLPCLFIPIKSANFSLLSKVILSIYSTLACLGLLRMCYSQCSNTKCSATQESHCFKEGSQSVNT